MIILLESYSLKTNWSLIPYSKEVEMTQLRAVLEVLLSSCIDTSLFIGESKHRLLCRSFSLARRGNSEATATLSPVQCRLAHMVLGRRYQCGRESLHILLAHLFKSQLQMDPVPNFQEYLSSIYAYRS